MFSNLFFTRTFSPSKPAKSLHTQKNRQFFNEPEENFWMVMVFTFTVIVRFWGFYPWGTVKLVAISKSKWLFRLGLNFKKLSGQTMVVHTFHSST